MKYADGPTASATVFVAAPPEMVWNYVSDIHFVASLSQEVQTVEWVNGEIRPARGRLHVPRAQHAPERGAVDDPESRRGLRGAARVRLEHRLPRLARGELALRADAL